MRSKHPLRLPAPYLRRVVLRPEKVEDWAVYPFNIPLLRHREFEFQFTHSVTVIVGENGTGKSTLLEAIAAIVGFDSAGGGPGYMPLDHSAAIEKNGDLLAPALQATWLPRISAGWFFKAESFFSIARYLDQAALTGMAQPPDFLSHSHGEGFLRFFGERCAWQGIYIFDEPESALSPTRQVEFLKLLRRMERSGICQVIVATHSPLLMSYPGADFWMLTRDGLEQSSFDQTSHFSTMRAFCQDPHGFLEDIFSE